MKERLGRVRLLKQLYYQFRWQLYLVLAALLILLGVSEHPLIGRVRIEIANVSSVVVSVLYKPIEGAGYIKDYVSNYLFVYDKNKQLMQENERLLFYINQAEQLASENKSLKQQLNFVVPAQYKYWTGYIMADSGGTFSSSVLLHIGRKDGIKRGFTVLYNDGLLGRIESVGYATSQVLLLTDYTSRVPVFVGKQNYPAVLSGDNSSLLKLHLLPEDAVVSVGDYVSTSGQGGVYPKGLAVGEIVKIRKDVIYVRPFVSREDTQFVRVVDFNQSGLIEKPDCDEKTAPQEPQSPEKENAQ